jgi:putative tricarboxylic transport membrane protein
MTSANTPAAVKTGGQIWVGCGVLAVGALMAVGAAMMPAEAGYSGVGPNFLPMLVSIVLLVCGAWIIWEAKSGGFRNMDAPNGASAGLLTNAALITTIGFILSCTLCFALAVRGLRTAELDKIGAFNGKQFFKDLLIGFAIAAPVFWMFTKLLAINLPGLTSTGWI